MVIAAVAIAVNQGVTGRTKHFMDQIHYVRHLVDHRYVIVQYVDTKKQRADGFTKALGKTDFQAWSSNLVVS